MEHLSELGNTLLQNWPIWFVTIVLIVAAVIDGLQLRVPNWLTYPLIFSGWIYSTAAFGWDGFLASLLGTLVGWALLMPSYAIGGMGAGDVKLLAGVGAWVHATHTFHAFCLTAIVGGLIAIGMVVYRRAWRKHWNQFVVILWEITTIRNPEELASIAAKRKHSMLLLPYGIPIMFGTILYFAWTGMLI